MCTLVLAHRCLPGAPLVVAANRDEFLARASTGPERVDGRPRILRPRDLVAGGTWLGLNQQGLFVGITNRAGTPPDRTRASRGALVAESLTAPDAVSLHQRLAALEARAFNPFHLLYADGEAAFVTWSDGEALRQYQVEPGVHVVTERSLGGDDRGRTERLRQVFEAGVAGREPELATLKELLVVHGGDGEPFAGSCVHADAFGYGTRSGFVYLGSKRPRAWWMEGHPCGAEPTELAAELDWLLGAHSG